MKRAEKVMRAQTIVEIVLSNKAIEKKLAEHNYSGQDVLEGQQLANRVQTLDNKQQQEYGARFEATDALNKARQEARDLYLQHLDSARIAFKKDRNAQKALDLTGTRRLDLSGWLNQAQRFYNNVAPFMKTLKKYNVNEAEIKQGSSMIEAVLEAYHKRREETDEAKTSTRQVQEAEQALDAWLSRFVKFSKAILSEEPELLETLGLTSKMGV